MDITLRDDQQAAIDKLREAYAEGRRRIVMQAATGWGKTVLAGALVRRARELGNRVIFTAPALSLIDQTVERLRSQGISDIGVLQANHRLTNPSLPVQVASISTLARRVLPAADVVIIDEVHRWYDFYEKWLADPAWADVPFIGLSATPWTKGLGKWFQELIVAGTTAQCIEAGTLSPFKVFAPSHPDLKGVRIVAGDYHEGQLSRVMSKASLVADVVNTWIKLGQSRPTLCFAVDCAHALLLQTQFADAGVPCGYQDASTPMSEREEIKRKFHNGEYSVVCNVGTLTTGVDWDVRCIVLARPTKSEMLFVQIIGRGLRTAPGKDCCLVLDHSNTHRELGFVTEIHHEFLDDGKPRPKALATEPPKLKKCPACMYLNPAHAMVCAGCGMELKAQIIVEAGELAELTPKAKPERVPAIAQGKAAVYGQLRSIAEARGYKSGWVAHKFRALFGVWPNAYTGLPAAPPTDEVKAWVKQQENAWRRTQRAAISLEDIEDLLADDSDPFARYSGGRNYRGW
jgi:DNA repair protein RadD